MKRTRLALPAALAAAGLLMAAAAPVLAGDEFCPMGGMLIKAEVDREKAIAWGRERRKAVVANEEKGDWSVLTLSVRDKDIAILLQEGRVFFGVAGKGKDEIDAKAAERAFGRDLGDLRDAVRNELDDLRKAGAVKIESGDASDLAKAAALGVFEKGRRDWEASTQDCTGSDLDASDL
jgi:hypothetical protein